MGLNPEGNSLHGVQGLPAVNDFVEGLVHQTAHLLGCHMLAGLFPVQQIGGAIALLQDLPYRQFDRLCILFKIG
jgi:hypothetical protein